MSNDMGKISNQDVPDEQKIEKMLSQFSPHPTPRFYAEMQNAPWTKTRLTVMDKAIKPFKPNRKVIWGLAILLLIMVLTGISFIPSVRVIARQVFFSFISAPSNQIEVQVTLSSPGDLFNFSDPTNFPLSINVAQQQAGFEVKEFHSIPEGLMLVGARFDPSYGAVTILYQAEGYYLFLTQRLVENGKDVFSIGAEAQVNQVRIGDNPGEYVAGGWKAISTQSTSETTSPGSQTNISAIWDESLPQYTLRWQSDGYSFEIRTLGKGSLSQSELIALADELK